MGFGGDLGEYGVWWRMQRVSSQQYY